MKIASDNIISLEGLECFWCKGKHLKQINEEKFECKSCGNVNYKLADKENIKFTLCSTYLSNYNYEDADKIYQQMSNSSNEKIRIQAIFGRLLAYFGVTYIEDYNGNLIVTFSYYDPNIESLKDSIYYQEIMNSSYKNDYIEKLNILDNEYKKIKIELDKGIEYDIFICTKISRKTKTDPDADGYTDDSRYANIIYDELTKKGLKVFYSDKLLAGIDYDAQIYSALMRSERILVIGSKREYLESPWVQSEWERWINFIKYNVKDKNSLYFLVPNDIPVVIPEKLKRTQKFTNDIEVINRIYDSLDSLRKSRNINEFNYNYPNIKTLIDRIEMLIEDGNNEKAKDLIEIVLNNDPKNPKVYFYLLLIDLNLKKEEELLKLNKPLNKYNNYNKALRFSRNEFKEKLLKYNDIILANINNEKNYDLAKDKINKKLYKEAIQYLKQINNNYKDSKELIEFCENELSKIIEGKYNKALDEFKNYHFDIAINLFNEIIDYKNSKELVAKCDELIKASKYMQAQTHLKNKEYSDAMRIFKEISFFKDSNEYIVVKITEKMYNDAIEYYNLKEYVKALNQFNLILKYKESTRYYNECKTKLESLYQSAMKQVDNYVYDEPIKVLNEIIDYKDSKEQIERIKKLINKEENYQKALEYMKYFDINKLKIAIEILRDLSGYKDSRSLINTCKNRIYDIEEKRNRKRRKLFLISSSILVLIIGLIVASIFYILPSYNLEKAKQYIKLGKYEDAEAILNELDGYSDSINQYNIINAYKEFQNGNYEEGINYLYEIGTIINIVYDLDGGNATKSSETIKNTIDTESKYPNFIDNVATKDGYNFYGWILDELTIYNRKDNYSADITIKASWDELIEYKIIYDLNGGFIESKPDKYTYEEEVYIPNPTKKGHTFVGWNDGNDIIDNYKIEYGSIGNISLVAVFTPNTYNINLDANGGECDTTKIQVVYGEKYFLPTPIKEGYEFINWESIPKTGIWNYEYDVSLKAKWEKEYYEIIYSLNGGSISNAPKVYTYEDEIVIPNPTKKGNTFIGWDDGNEITKDLKYNRHKTGNISLEAIFEPIIYEITLNANGGIIDKHFINVTYGSSYELPIPSKDGYFFDGWYYVSDKTERIYDGRFDRTYNMTVIAKWSIPYTIVYELDGGICNYLPTEFTNNDKFELPTPTKNGFYFIGWYDNETDTKVTELDNKNYVLYAKWGIELGKYPQIKIYNQNLINVLNNITTVNNKGYIEYYGKEYKKYDDSYYSVDPIKWIILEENNNTYKLVSDVILDSEVFYSDTESRKINDTTIYSNNYEYSNIRAWLNGYDGSSYNVDNYTGKGFIDIAFTEEERKIINETQVDNSALTTGIKTNNYACNNTLDKVYLLSYQDVTNKYFTSKAKTKVTDYAIAKGVYEYSNGYGRFWLRSPFVDSSDYACYVDYDGDIYNCNVNYSIIGARPALEITIK